MMLKKPKNVSHFTINYMLNRLLFISIALLFFSCGNEKVLQLSEIQNATITEILDVSPAYIFYDETKQDSVELNRKNLIISTNWLVNVDKRLTLEQALPSIIKLQEKKRNATMHKNEKARNYYTCNDTSIKNLGFIDFTDVVYSFDKSKAPIKDNAKLYNEKVIDKTSSDYQTTSPWAKISPEHYFGVELFLDSKDKIYAYSKDLLKSNQLEDYLSKIHNKVFIEINFNKKISIQDYISFKSLLKNIESENIIISINEFIY